MFLINELFPERKANTLRKIWKDDDSSRPEILKQLGLEIQRSKAILTANATDQLISMLSIANFKYEKSEPLIVALIIRKYARENNILPYLTDYLPEHQDFTELTPIQSQDIGSRCLVALGFFYEGLHSRFKKHAAPHPRFYRTLGREAFQYTETPEIAENFVNWEKYLRNTFKAKNS